MKRLFTLAILVAAMLAPPLILTPPSSAGEGIELNRRPGPGPGSDPGPSPG